MFADHHHSQVRRVQDAPDQLRELTVAKHACLAVRADVDLFENFTRRGERFGEHGRVIRDARGHAVQIHDRQRQEFGEGAIVAQDSKHTSPLAMRGNSAAAVAAHFPPPVMTKSQPSAGKVNFSYNASPNPVFVTCAGDPHYLTYEFMAERALKIVIPAQDFNIGIADSRQANLD
jgi:hypothetical protein